MSALGDYIHLRTSNYMKYGTKQINSGESNAVPNINAQDFLNKRMAANLKPVTNKEINILKQRLKANTSSRKTAKLKEMEKEQSKIIDEIYELLYSKVSTLSAARRYSDIASGDFWVGKQHIVKDGNWMSGKSYDELKKNYENANRLEKKINNLITEINNSPQPQDDKKIKELIGLYEQLTGMAPEGEPTVEEIKKSISDYRFTATKQSVAGWMGEALVAACGDVATTLGKDTIKTYLQQAMVGNQQSKIEFSKDLIAKGKAPFLNTSSKDGTKYSLGSTQNKVDTQIQINGKDLDVSVKNYSDHGRPPKLQDVNLLQTLTYLNSQIEDFGNHWLNLHASTVNIGGDNLDELVEKEVAYEALAGGSPFKSGNAHANVFAFMNRETGYVFVESSKNLLKKFDRFRISPSISSIALQNRSDPDGYQDRITNILHQVHTIKIHVALNVTM